MKQKTFFTIFKEFQLLEIVLDPVVGLQIRRKCINKYTYKSLKKLYKTPVKKGFNDDCFA